MASPEVLLVSTPEPSSLTDAYSLLKALYHNPNFVEDETTIHIVTNRVNSQDEGQAIYEKVNSVVSKFFTWKSELSGDDSTGCCFGTGSKTAKEQLP